MLVISSRFPAAPPNLIAYQLLIAKQAKRCRYPSWLYYDIEFRKWAAATKTKEWGHINSEIYTQAFTSQGTMVTWCPTCQAHGKNHAYDCTNFFQAATFSLCTQPPNSSSIPPAVTLPEACCSPLPTPSQEGKVQALHPVH